MAASLALAQLQLSPVSGRVLDPDGAPVRLALVALTDSLGYAIATVTSDDEGRFRLPGVAPGVYLLGAQAPALRSPAQRFTVLNGLPAEIDLQLSPHVSESVAVEADTSGAGGGAGTTLAGEAVRRAPAALRRNALGPRSPRRRAGPRKTTASYISAAPTTGSFSSSTACRSTSASTRSSPSASTP
jgi:hypothetical protein